VSRILRILHPLRSLALSLALLAPACAIEDPGEDDLSLAPDAGAGEAEGGARVLAGDILRPPQAGEIRADQGGPLGGDDRAARDGERTGPRKAEGHQGSN